MLETNNSDYNLFPILSSSSISDSLAKSFSRYENLEFSYLEKEFLTDGYDFGSKNNSYIIKEQTKFVLSL